MKERLDHRVICRLVEQEARVLDLGCGDGALMALLVCEKNASVQGIELNDEAVHKCVEKGLTVFQGDIESGLTDYPDGSFDDVILNQSIQEIKKVDFVIEECFRIGRRVIVGFPNFAHIASRWSLFFRGRTPVTPSLPHRWYETPNVRFLTIKDLEDFCTDKGLRILQAVYLGANRALNFLPNLFARNAIFVVTKKPKGAKP